MRSFHVSVFGLGRSGLAVAKAALAHGMTASVYDQSDAEKLSKPELLDEAKAIGAEVEMGWNGVLPSMSQLHTTGKHEWHFTFYDSVSKTGSDEVSKPEGPWLVVNPAVDMRIPILAAAQNQGYEILSEIEFAFRISKAPIIAITGTNGKSTTTVMTYLCLKQCGIDAVLCGNIFGSGYPEVPLTEAALNSTENQILVAEISSFQLEWVKHFRPVSAGITNISADHLDRYDSFEQYAATKERIFSAQAAGDFAIVKAKTSTPDPSSISEEFSAMPLSSSREMEEGSTDCETRDGATILTFGEAGKHARIDEHFLTILDKQLSLDELHFSEPHNYQNASMAALLAYGGLAGTAARIPQSKAAQVLNLAKIASKNPEAEHFLPDCILEGLKQFRGIAHRLEFVGEKDGIKVINNSMCTNPDAVLKSATSLRAPTHVLIGGKNKDLNFRPLKPFFANGMNHAYAYGEAKAQLAEQLGTIEVYETMEDAAAAALSQAKSGDVVMLAPGCASTDQFRDFRHRGDVFKQLAKEWLIS